MSLLAIKRLSVAYGAIKALHGIDPQDPTKWATFLKDFSIAQMTSTARPPGQVHLSRVATQIATE